MIRELLVFVIHWPCSLVAKMRFMWPAINKRSHLGFSNLFDDYPDRIDTTKSVSFLPAKLV